MMKNEGPSQDKTIYYQQVTVKMHSQEMEHRDQQLFFRINQSLNGHLHFEVTNENN